MINCPIIGQTYWTSLWCEDENSTVEAPWQGVLENDNGTYLLVSPQNERDYAFVAEEDLFASRAEATQNIIQHHLEHLLELNKEMKEVLSRIETLQASG